jgi:hypothetical protein
MVFYLLLAAAGAKDGGGDTPLWIYIFIALGFVGVFITFLRGRRG